MRGMPTLDRRQTIQVLAVLILLGAALRFHDLAASSMWYDEGFTLCYAGQIDGTLHSISPDITSDAPLMAVLLHGWEKCLALFPRLQPGTFAYDWMLRLIACLFSIASIPLAYWVGRIVTRESAPALITAFFVAISPFQVFYAHEIKPYSLYLMLSLLTLAAALAALENDRRRAWLALPCVMSLTLYSHFFTAWNVATLNLYFLLMIGRYRRHFWKWSAAQVAFVILSLPSLLQAAKINKMFESVRNIYTIRPDLQSGFITFKTFFAGYSPHPVLYYPLLVLAGVAFLGGLWALRRRPNALVLAVVLTVVPIAGNVVVWRLRHFPLYEHRLFILASVMVYIVVALAIVQLPSRRLQVGVCFLFAAFMLPALGDYYHQRIHPLMTHRMGVRYKVQSREAAAYVRSHWRPGDIVAHASHFTYFPFQYYLSGLSAPQANVCLSAGDLEGFLNAYPNPTLWNTYGAMPVRIDEYTQSAPRVWWIESWWEPFDIPPHLVSMRGWMDGHFPRADIHRFDGVTVYLYDRNPARVMPPYSFRYQDFSGDWGVDFHSDTGMLEAENRGPARTLDVRVTASAVAVSPMELNRSDSRNDVWQPQPECLPGASPIPTNVFVMAAFLMGAGGNGAALHKDLTLPSGEYVLFARTFSNTDPVNKYRANLVFHKMATENGASGEVLGRIAGNDPAATVGWGWHRVARVQADGRPFRLGITVHNDDALEKAYADLGRMAFVQVMPGEPEPAAPEYDRFEWRLGAQAIETRGIARSPLCEGNTRIDVDMFDDAVHEYRHVFFPAPARGDTEQERMSSMAEYPMQAIAPTVARLLHVPAPAKAEAGPIDAVIRDLDGVPRVAVLGIDALGMAIYRHWRDRMPFLASLEKEAFAKVRSIPISKTPVNFGCMVTGASMNVHGATEKERPFQCETLFDVLRHNGKRSAGLGRNDWTGHVLLGRHADITTGGAAADDEAVESCAHRIIREDQPDFLIIQYGLTDELFHRDGPYAPENEETVRAADAWLERMAGSLRKASYGIIILADHGQHSIEREAGGRAGTHGSDSDEDCIVPLTWTR